MTTVSKKTNKKERTLSGDLLEKLTNMDDGVVTLQKLHNVPDNKMELLYDKGYHFYQQGLNENAEHIFSFLVKLNPYIPKYWMGMAAAKQLLKKYKDALYDFAMVSILDPDDPRPNFHSAECYMSLKKPKNAKKELIIAEKKKDHPKMTDAMLTRIILMKDTVNKQIKVKRKKK